MRTGNYPSSNACVSVSESQILYGEQKNQYGESAQRKVRLPPQTKLKELHSLLLVVSVLFIYALRYKVNFM